MDLDIEGIKESGSFLNTLYNEITSAIFLADRQARVHHFNDPFKALFHLPDDDALMKYCGNLIGCSFVVDEGRDCGETSNCGSCPLRRDILRSFAARAPVYRDTLRREFVVADRRIIKHFCFTTKYIEYLDQEFVLVIIDDITALEKSRIEAEERAEKLDLELRASTVELLANTKELATMQAKNDELCREIRHRVGNSMQVISSLLYLEHFEGSDRRSRSLENRIEAIVGVYSNSQYEERGQASVRVPGLLEFLVDLFAGLGRIDVERVPERMRLGVDRAVSFALAVEDIISYLVGPFHPCDRPSRDFVPGIALSIEAGEGGAVVASMRMEDPFGLNRAARDLVLARSMIHQLGGSLTMTRDSADGRAAETRFELRFPEG